MLLFSAICEELHWELVDSGHWGCEDSSGRVVGIAVVEESVVKDVRPLCHTQGCSVAVLGHESHTLLLLAPRPLVVWKGSKGGEGQGMWRTARACEGQGRWRTGHVKDRGGEGQGMWRTGEVKDRACEGQGRWRTGHVKDRGGEGQGMWRIEEVKDRACEGQGRWRTGELKDCGGEGQWRWSVRSKRQRKWEYRAVTSRKVKFVHVAQRKGDCFSWRDQFMKRPDSFLTSVKGFTETSVLEKAVWPHILSHPLSPK